MGLKPLAVAGAAAVLLALVLGVDATMNRVYTVDIWTGDAWRAIAEFPQPAEPMRSKPMVGGATVDANRSDTLRFRVTVDNAYWWAFSEDYSVYHDSDEIASGELAAGARSRGEAEFTMPAARVIGSGGYVTEYREPVPPGTKGNVTNAGLQVFVGNEQLWPNFNVREV